MRGVGGDPIPLQGVRGARSGGDRTGVRGGDAGVPTTTTGVPFVTPLGVPTSSSAGPSHQSSSSDGCETATRFAAQPTAAAAGSSARRRRQPQPTASARAVNALPSASSLPALVGVPSGMGSRRASSTSGRPRRQAIAISCAAAAATDDAHSTHTAVAAAARRPPLPLPCAAAAAAAATPTAKATPSAPSPSISTVRAGGSRAARSARASAAAAE